VPRLELYAQSFGLPLKVSEHDVWRRVARELISRGAPLSSVRS
jgi:hypothetical protein